MRFRRGRRRFKKCKSDHISATLISLLTDRTPRIPPSEFNGCEGSHAATRHQNLVLQERDRIAHVVIEQVVAVETHCERLDVAKGTCRKSLCIRRSWSRWLRCQCGKRRATG